MIQVHGECFNKAEILEDSIVKMHGFIYDTISEGPKKIAVHAKLIIESLPYGSQIGIISSHDTSGYYEYQVNLNHRYSVDIRSEIYQKFSEEINPNDIVSNGEISKNFYLQPEIKEKQVIRLQRLIFEQGSARITSDSYGELDYIVKTMHQNPDMEIRLEGHTDTKGSRKLNMELSKERVEAVKLYLTVKGINSKRIKTKAYGGNQPLATDGSAEASRLNRRVEVRILKL
jgi:outer membrane protein OmpA-like peptidoglycan-associated protein